MRVRFLTSYGEYDAGRAYDLPRELAERYRQQGLAEEDRMAEPDYDNKMMERDYETKAVEANVIECSKCGMRFETRQELGGHFRWHH